MRKDPTLTQAEAKLAIIIWQEAPLTSPELVLLAEQKLHWKKSTTYTVLKRLCDKGVFKMTTPVFRYSSHKNSNLPVKAAAMWRIVSEGACRDLSRRSWAGENSKENILNS